MTGLPSVDAVVDAFLREERAPGLAFGVVADGRLIHSRGVGASRVGSDDVPGADTVFRIASMTKSFTASTVLLLRDEERLRLDDRAAEYVPELADLEPGRRLTIRELLTMSSGLASDDPWGDRQQDLDLERFSALLRRGQTFAWTPGTMFEYSNLGYGILGRAITNVAGAEYREVVRSRVLEPLGMTSTVFEPADVDGGRLAIGYVEHDDAFVEEPFAGYGALAAMGGLFSTVSDLAVWVDGFVRTHADRGSSDDHPLSRASRLEMQQGFRMTPPEMTWESVAHLPTALVTAYGMGLFARWDLELGLTISHSGGYPGFGSHMRWHPASGLGVVVLANRTYYPASTLGEKLLREVVRTEIAPTRRLSRAPTLERARADVERLIASWDDALAQRIFAMNVDLDEPLERRRAAMERLRETHGALRRSQDEPVAWSPLGCEWWLEGERGRVKLEISMSPEAEPKVQWFEITSVPAPEDAHLAAAGSLVALANGDPADVLIGSGVDRAIVDRDASLVRALFGRVRLGGVTAGEESERTFAVEGERGRLELVVRIGADGRLETVTWKPRPVEPPLFDVR